MLFEAAYDDVGLGGGNAISTPLPASRGVPAALLLSREWSITDLEHRLVEAIEASYEPTWDTERNEFTWGLGLQEPHPRGQFNAFLAAAELGAPGAWARLSAAPLPPCPQVVDVDFPTMAFATAEWVDETLHLHSAPARPAPSERTSFVVTGVHAPADNWMITSVDGTSVDGVTLDPTDDGLHITMPVVAAELTISRRPS